MFFSVHHSSATPKHCTTKTNHPKSPVFLKLIRRLENFLSPAPKYISHHPSPYTSTSTSIKIKPPQANSFLLFLCLKNFPALPHIRTSRNITAYAESSLSLSSRLSYPRETERSKNSALHSAEAVYRQHEGD